MSRPPLSPFTPETAAQKARLAEDAWNTRDPARVALAYTPDSRWRNRAEFLQGRAAIEAFLTRKWNREFGYRLIKEVWACRDNRIAVRFAYEWHDGQYADFWQTTEDSLMFAAELLKLVLTPDKHEKLMASYLELKTWPEVPSVLESLRNAGIRLAFLSNATSKILDAGIKSSGLGGAFEHILSTNEIKTYKPDPRAYQMAIDAFALRKEEILFVAFAGWDAAGAKAFGYTTFWVNRINLPVERLGVSPDGVGKSLDDLLGFVKPQR